MSSWQLVFILICHIVQMRILHVNSFSICHFSAYLWSQIDYGSNYQIIFLYFRWRILAIIVDIKWQRQNNSSVALSSYQGNFSPAGWQWLAAAGGNDQVILWLFKDADFVRNKINILIVTGNFDLLRRLDRTCKNVQNNNVTLSRIDHSFYQLHCIVHLDILCSTIQYSKMALSFKILLRRNISKLLSCKV